MCVCVCVCVCVYMCVGGEMVALLEAVGGVKGRAVTHGCQPAGEQNDQQQIVGGVYVCVYSRAIL